MNKKQRDFTDKRDSETEALGNGVSMFKDIKD